MAQLTGCGSCVKDEPKPGQGPSVSELPARENKLKVVGVRKPYLGTADGATSTETEPGDASKSD